MEQVGSQDICSPGPAGPPRERSPNRTAVLSCVPFPGNSRQPPLRRSSPRPIPSCQTGARGGDRSGTEAGLPRGSEEADVSAGTAGTSLYREAASKKATGISRGGFPRATGHSEAGPRPLGLCSLPRPLEQGQLLGGTEAGSEGAPGTVPGFSEAVGTCGGGGPAGGRAARRPHSRHTSGASASPQTQTCQSPVGRGCPRAPWPCPWGVKVQLGRAGGVSRAQAPCRLPRRSRAASGTHPTPGIRDPPPRAPDPPTPRPGTGSTSACPR